MLIRSLAILFTLVYVSGLGLVSPPLATFNRLIQTLLTNEMVGGQQGGLCESKRLFYLLSHVDSGLNALRLALFNTALKTSLTTSTNNNVISFHMQEEDWEQYTEVS